MPKIWGILGKLQKLYSEGEIEAEKPKEHLNANPFNSWDYKKSRYRRIDLYPKGVSEAAQQGGVVSTPSVTPTPVPVTCDLITFYTDGAIDPVFEFTDCSGNTIQFNGPQGFSADFCGDINSASIISGDGVIEYAGVCSDPANYNSQIIPLGYDANDLWLACQATPTDYYLIAGDTLIVGTTIYSDYSTDASFVVSDGYYSDGSTAYFVSGGSGQITSTQVCSVTWSGADTQWNNESATWDTI